MERGASEHEKTWQNYLKEFFRGVGASLFVNEESGLPRIFAKPACATCHYWHLIHRDGLSQLSEPNEYDLIEKGLNGKILKIVYLDDNKYDSYRDFVFYGWCKRYPPTNRDSYSITSFRSLLSLVTRKIPLKIADYQFPLLSHSNSCGEWRKAEWVEDFINEHKQS